MTLKQWNTAKIKQYKQTTGQALLSDEQSLVSFSKDFGKLIHSAPSAVCMPSNIDSIQSLISFAQEHQLPVTIRGNGLSQGGQSLPVAGGLTLSMQNFNKILTLEGDLIWVEANASWADLLAVTLQQGKAPFVLPYNCNLSVAGVLSAGGVGASSFKYGSINAHVHALEVIDGLGIKQTVDKNTPLFKACMSGQGRCAVITKVCIELKPVPAQIRTFFLVYSDQEQWFNDIKKVKDKADYMELFCSPSIQGAKLQEGKRVPMAQWLYGIHMSVAYEQQAPELEDVADIKPWQVLNTQDEPTLSYFLRHNSRFELMKMLGQWDLLHPWYECFVGMDVVKKHLADVLQKLPVHFANLVHVVPIAKQHADLFMLPDDETVCEIMILNPGIPALFKDSCLQAIQELDAFFLAHGGKRYLSGTIAQAPTADYWRVHYGTHYDSWLGLKKQFDPVGIFSSMLYP